MREEIKVKGQLPKKRLIAGDACSEREHVEHPSWHDWQSLSDLNMDSQSPSNTMNLKPLSTATLDCQDILIDVLTLI